MWITAKIPDLEYDKEMNKIFESKAYDRKQELLCNKQIIKIYIWTNRICILYSYLFTYANVEIK